MARPIKRERLDQVLNAAGLSDTDKARVHAANEGTTAPERPKGHGAPAPTRVTRRAL